MMNKNLQHIEKAMKHIKAIEPETDMDKRYIRQLKTMLHNMRMKMEARFREVLDSLPEIPSDEPPDDAICTREVKHDPHKIGELIDSGQSKFHCGACPVSCEITMYGKDLIIPTECPYSDSKANWQEVKDKLSDEEFNEIADTMEQVGKDIEKEKQLNSDDIKKLEEHMASDEYIEQLRQKQQTDCKKCIYQISKLGNLPNEENNVGFIKGKRNATMGYGIKVCCQFDLRESRPICPLFDDGKEVKQ